VRALPAATRNAFLDVFVHALHGAFAMGAVFSALAFLLTWALPQIELRSSTAAQMRDQARAAPAEPAQAAEVVAR
jgi:hypothetical protein